MSTRSPRLGTLLVALALGSLPSASPCRASWIAVDAGRGAVAVQLPDSPEPVEGWPLLVLLHGFGASGAIEELYVRFAQEAAAAGFAYALPDGTLNPNQNRFWNATDACCDTYGSGVDDVRYLSDLVDAIAIEAGVDRRKVFFFGHSNGGFMAYRMACDRADLAAGVVVLAGASFDDSERCAPIRKVPVLHIHGTADDTIYFEGGTLLAPYPGAERSTELWAGYDGCELEETLGQPFDADAAVPGTETTPRRRTVGCRSSSVELWAIEGGTHLPDLTDDFRTRLRDWLLAATANIFADDFESGDLRAWSRSVP